MRRSTSGGRNGVGARFERRQIVHVIVEGFERAVRGIADHLMQAPVFGLAGEQAASHVERLLQVGLHVGQHREAARHMEAADHHWNAGGAQRPRDVERARKLVRLHADQPDHAEAAMARELRDNVFGADARVGLVNRGNVDLDISTEHLPRHRVLRERVEAGERIGRDRGADPLNDVALVVIVRGLDQHELEATLGTRNRHENASPLTAWRERCG